MRFEYKKEVIEQLSQNKRVMSCFTKEDGAVFADDDACNFVANEIGASIFTGATKIALVSEYDAAVVKIPFRGRLDCFGDYVNFRGANDLKEGWDYCAAELIILEKAKSWGVEACFAYQEHIGDLNGHPVYAQEKCTIWSHIHDYFDYSDEKRSSTEKYVKDKGYYCFNECWLSDFLDYYGTEILDKFLNFIETEDIDDLHDSNIGYVGKRPVIVDYGSYHEEDDDYWSYYSDTEDEEED